jgi:hypothetical protein
MLLFFLNIGQAIHKCNNGLNLAAQNVRQAVWKAEGKGSARNSVGLRHNLTL